MKKYTIEDLSNGVCALKNDGTVENLQLVLDRAFPKDGDKVKDWMDTVSNNRVIAFQSTISRDDLWCQFYEGDNVLPMQSCAVFLEDIYQNIPMPKGGMNSDSEPSIGAVVEPIYAKNIREFSTGATRNLDDDKLDFNGFLSPLALEEFAKYMHKNRMQADGKMRDSDNWQKGIEINSYMSSMWRHFFDTWKSHRGLETPEDQISNLCGLLFNVQGMLHELLKNKIIK